MSEVKWETSPGSNCYVRAGSIPKDARELQKVYEEWNRWRHIRQAYYFVSTIIDRIQGYPSKKWRTMRIKSLENQLAAREFAIVLLTAELERARATFRLKSDS